MNIYELSKKQLFQLLRSFSKTEYGKIQFLISYSLAFILLIIVCILGVMIFASTKELRSVIVSWMAVVSLLDLVAFTAGTMHYYSELRFYCYKINDKK